MILSPLNVPPEEREQILQTIEMFEVIMEASPRDCQSMEILRDAYLRLGRTPEALTITRRLADAHIEQGQLSQAIYEYEGILRVDSTNAEVIAALSALRERLNSQPLKPPLPDDPADIPQVLQPSEQMLDPAEIEFQTIDPNGGTLMAISETRGAERIGANKLITPEHTIYSPEGNQAFGKFLMHNRLVPQEIVNSALDRVAKKNVGRQPHTMAVSLLEEICRRGSMDLETLLCGIIDRSKFAYIPLEYYDVDRSVARMLPEHLTVGSLMVPFDVMSRTVMIATANPFDAAAKTTAQQLLDFNIQWHLSSPEAITQVLMSLYKVGAPAEPPAFRLSV